MSHRPGRRLARPRAAGPLGPPPPRPRSLSPKRNLTQDEKRMQRELPEHERPRTRGECAEGPRPCPYASCRHHLFLEVDPVTGTIRFNFPQLEVWELTETCSLDVAERDGITLEEVGALVNLTRERIRQVEVGALALVGRAAEEMDALEGEIVEGEAPRED